jgi:hypothetical protein
MTTKTYTLASTFADDHWERGCGETDIEVKRTANRVTVELDAEGYSDMLTDADYYWDMRSEMDGLEGIVRSAKRVLDALLQAGPPEGYVVTRRGYSYRVDLITPVPA